MKTCKVHEVGTETLFFWQVLPRSSLSLQKKMFIPPELLILCSVGVLLVNSTQCGRCGPKESRREEMILHKIM